MKTEKEITSSPCPGSLNRTSSPQCLHSRETPPQTDELRDSEISNQIDQFNEIQKPKF